MALSRISTQGYLSTYRHNVVPAPVAVEGTKRGGLMLQRTFTPHLLSKMGQSLGAVQLHFEPEHMRLVEELGGEFLYPEGRFISRTFRRAEIESLSLPEGGLMMSRHQKTILENLLMLAEAEDLIGVSNVLAAETGSLAAFVSFQELREPAPIPVVPGELKHYTTLQGINGIQERGRFRATTHTRYGEAIPMISFTRLNLSRQEAQATLFTPHEVAANPQRGSHVIGFDIPGVLRPRITSLKSDTIHEVWCLGDLLIGEINIRHMGPNPMPNY